MHVAYKHTFTNKHACTPRARTHRYSYKHTMLHTHAYTHTYPHKHMRTHTHTHARAQTYAHIHIRTHTRVRAHTNANTNTHARTRAHTQWTYPMRPVPLTSPAGLRPRAGLVTFVSDALTLQKLLTVT